MKGLAESLVAAKWKVPSDLSRSFFGFPPLLRYTQELIGGDPDRDCYQWTVDTYLSERLPVPRALSLACGHGHVERLLAERGVFRECLGLDLAPGAIEQARRLAAGAGLENLQYRVADLNRLQLEPGSFDLILAVGALHHVSDLEHVLDEVHRALSPGGLLVSNEYIGPDRWQVSPRQYELINAAIHLIPPDLRERREENHWPPWLWPLAKLEPRLARRRLNPLAPLHALRRLLIRRPAFGRLYDPPPPWYWMLRDPSEGVHASQIVSSIRRRFEDVNVRPYNGSILYFALDQAFYERYDDSNPRHRRVLDMLCEIERELVALGEVPSAAAHIVARKTG